MKRRLVLTCAIAASLIAGQASAAEYYVSASTGKGRVGSRAEPVRDLGNLAGQLKPGDTVYLAAGVYPGKADTGRDLFTIPLKLVGGFDPTFAKRDPWGAFTTVLSGDNKSQNFDPGARLEFDLTRFKGKHEVGIDGLIIDNASRNNYANDGHKVVRANDASSGAHASPASAGILVKLGANGSALIEHCVVTNVANTTGDLTVIGAQGAKATIRRNLIVNNTGSGIEAGSTVKPKGKLPPSFTIEDNTVALSWKHVPYAGYGVQGGFGLAVSGEAVVIAAGNLFAFSDVAGVHNPNRVKTLTLKDNLFVANASDYVEEKLRLQVGKLEDDAECLGKMSSGNVSGDIVLPLPHPWAEHYAMMLSGRPAADLKAPVARARAMLGLDPRGGDPKADASVWMHKLSTEQVLKLGAVRYLGKFGCEPPSPSVSAVSTP
ncbi:MAG: hypothetical protein ACYC8T_05645 [Myxococcaceae bacterium]